MFCILSPHPARLTYTRLPESTVVQRSGGVKFLNENLRKRRHHFFERLYLDLYLTKDVKNRAKETRTTLEERRRRRGPYITSTGQ